MANAGPYQYVKVNQTVNFDGGKSYDPDADTLSFKWDFGDSTSTGWLTSSKTSHSYNSPGNYTVTLTVSDSLLIDTDTCKISVSGTGSNNNSAPVANAGSNQYVKVNQTVNFDGSGSYDSNGDPLTYKWDFGDGSSTGWLSSSKTSHSYKNQGNYTVILTVSDSKLSDDDTCKVYVTKQQQNSSLPKIISSSIQQNSQNISINYSKIEIDFSKSMNHSSVESALSINPGINYTILWGNNGSKLQIIFNENLLYNTSYKITIGTGAKDLEEKYLKNPFKLDFTTEIEHQNGEKIDPSDEPLNGLNLLENLNLLWILTLLITIVILILSLIIRNSRKKQEKHDDDVKESIDRHELSGGNLAEDFYFDDEFTKYSNELIKELKKDSLSLKKPSDFKLSNDEMLDKLNKQYSAGQISKTAYNSVKDTLIEYDN